MKRSSFIKRLAGLLTAAAVAPEVLAAKTTQDVPGVGGTMFQYPLTQEQVFPEPKIQNLPDRYFKPPVRGNILTDQVGRMFYVTDVEGENVRVQLLEDGGIFTISMDQCTKWKEYAIVCSAMPG